MSGHHDQPRANKTDAGNGSKAICRVSNVLRSPSPDPKRCAKKMKTLPVSANDDQILQLAREWAEALSREDYQAAYDITAHDPYYQWTPDLMRTVIQNYGSTEPLADGSICRVTPIDTAHGGPTPRHLVERDAAAISPESNGARSIGSVWFDIPLDGEWSDLTATFEIRSEEDLLHLVLNEIHVF